MLSLIKTTLATAALMVISFPVLAVVVYLVCR
jgi:hypothetical protein